MEGGTLHLTLRKKWWEMIESGEKLEEYREIKPYWIRRLCRHGKDEPTEGYRWNMCVNGGCQLSPICANGEVTCTKYDYVCFHYGRTARTMLFEIGCIFVGKGDPKWGAPQNEDVFIIQLYRRVL